MISGNFTHWAETITAHTKLPAGVNEKKSSKKTSENPDEKANAHLLDLCSGSGVSRTEGNHWQQGHLKKVALIGFIISHGGAVITYHEEALCMKSAFIFIMFWRKARICICLKTPWQDIIATVMMAMI